MPTPDQQSNTANAILAIRNAQNLLQQQINASSNTLTAIKLTNEYNSLDSSLSQLLHAQNIADDAIFSKMIETLKSQTGGLQADEAAIKGIISDVGTAAKVVGYITQALSFIAKL
ncbi:MAG TPA: hypothetical protein VNF99_12470 [Stellaceae bacterium]|nr:hypothetical protein [Stellaceae bacterium]